MKYFILFATLSLAACSTPPGKYKEEKNTPRFADSRSFTEKPDEILRAARAVLDDLSRESDPPATAALKSTDESIRTGWVYSTSKDKYVEYNHNGSPRRKTLSVRRRYSYTAVPSLAGSQVTYGVEEEIQKVDLTTGEPKGWENVDPSPAAYDMLAKRLRQKIGEQ